MTFEPSHGFRPNYRKTGKKEFYAQTLKSIDFENLDCKDSKFSFKDDLGRRLKSNSIKFQRLAEGRRRPASDIYNIFKNYIAVDGDGDDYGYECQLEMVLVDSVVVDRMVMVAASSG
ncbi:hypothetical protein H5410_023471 [Solanum commersonii]|uniref:Uncharacterized protein n=1 Tax=Solanum commersonii TaxID=4109 RepID=A0A9J5ZK26_SOLCO|nr:hypothetical protein H5410_023471 [Solanum commersonii]